MFGSSKRVCARRFIGYRICGAFGIDLGLWRTIIPSAVDRVYVSRLRKMSLQTVLYNTLFKRTSTFVVTIMAGSFVFERTFDIISETIFESINQGRLWKHIKHNYEK